MGRWDVLGMFTLDLLDNETLNIMQLIEAMDKAAMDKTCCPEVLAPSFNEVIANLRSILLESLQQKSLNNNTKSLIAALRRMFIPTPQEKTAYGEEAGGVLFKCSRYVRAVLIELGAEFKFEPTAGVLVNSDNIKRDTGVDLPERKGEPQPGDIVSGGTEGAIATNEAHTTISVGAGLVIGHHPIPRSPEVKIDGHNITIRPIANIIEGHDKVTVREPKIK